MEWVWSMWGWVWPTFNSNKFKVDLKTCMIRTNLHKLKQQETLQKEKSEILELIRNNKTELARIKVEGIIHHYRKISAYDILNNYCESLSSRIDLLQTPTRDTASEVLNSVNTIVYASSRLNVPELKELAYQLKTKFGNSIGDNTVESSSVWIDKKIIDYLSTELPDEETIDKYLQEFYGQVESSEYPSPLVKSPRRSNSQSFITPTEESDQSYEPPASTQPYVTSPYAPPHFTHSAMPESLPGTPAPSSPYPVLSHPATPLSPSTPPFPSSPYPSQSYTHPPSYTPPFISPSPSPIPSTPTTPLPLYPNPLSPVTYVDPSLLYNSPCTTYASAPFASPPPENPEFTAHAAAATKTHAHTHEYAHEREHDEHKQYGKGTNMIKKEALTPMRARVSLKKVRPTKIRKSRSNPFQQGASRRSPAKQEEMEYYDSSEEEQEKKQGDLEGANSLLSLNARLEALKKPTS